RAALTVAVEALGGLAVGLVASPAVIRLMRQIDDFAVEVALTLALAMGVYAGAQALGLSGPIAVVGAGLLIGDHHAGGPAATTEAHLESFWGLVDEILNALLFFLLGLQLAILPLQPGLAALALAAVALVLAARLLLVLPWGAHLGHRIGRGRAS